MNTYPAPLESSDMNNKRPIQFTGWWKATIVSIFIIGIGSLMLQIIEIQALNQIYARQKAIMEVYAGIAAVAIVSELPNNKGSKEDLYQIKNKIAEKKATILDDMQKVENKASGVKPDVKKP